MNWYFQFTPGDMWDYDEVGTHILIDGVVAGQPRKLITHSARNGFLYAMDRFNGQTVLAKPYVEVNWTKGIDQKTGKPLDYDPSKDIQTYAGVGNLTPGEPLKKVCPSHAGGNNYWPSSYSPKTKLLYIPTLTTCVNVSIDREKHNKEKGWNGGLSQTSDRWESNVTAVDFRDRRDKENRAFALPELCRHAGNRRGPRLQCADGRHRCSLRRHHPR
jgi:alcohol dehydrogenase (cytochrome c)